MLRITYTRQYHLQEQEILAQDPHLASLIDRTLELLQKNPEDTRLRNHPLHKRLSDRFAISITDDIRIIYRWMGKHIIRLIAIGTHEEVYKKN